jgi:ornithine cyclodeaminase
VSIPVLSAEEIERLLPMRDCIAVMEQAFVDLQRGVLHHPLRTFWAPPGVDGGTMWMAAYRSSPKPMFGTKLLFVLNDNPSRGLDSHQGQVILADGETESCARCWTHPP